MSILISSEERKRNEGRRVKACCFLMIECVQLAVSYEVYVTIRRVGKNTGLRALDKVNEMFECRHESL